jgi:hypothetical protein
VTRTAGITSRWRLPKWSSLSRGNGHRITVLAHRPGRYPAHRLAALRPCRSRPQGGPSFRRGPEPPASSRKGTSRGASPLRSGTLLVDLERRDTVLRPSMSWPASCRPTRRWVAADRQATVPARGRSSMATGGGHAADQAPGWPARCGATAEGLPTPRYPTTSSTSLCSTPSSS